MKKLIILVIIFMTSFSSIYAAENVGVIKGIWFSESPFFDGDTIRVYTALQNNSGDDAHGSIEFFDNGDSLGVKSFSVLNNRIIESWIDTIAKSGEHEFSVRITQLKKGDANITAQEIFSERIEVVKIDTDGDNISDDIDTDDDGDGISDVDELAAGSDPLDSDSIPVDETETTNNPITTIINNIFNTDSINNNTENTNQLNGSGDSNKIQALSQEKIDLLEQSPDVAQKIAEQNNLIKSLVLQVSRLQNGGKNIIEHEKNRIEKKVSADKETVINNNTKESKNVALQRQVDCG